MIKTIALAAAVAVCSTAFGSGVIIDASRDRHPISPEIYGVILCDDTQIARMGVTVRRHGGNELTRFNWKASISNTGGDGKFFSKVGANPIDTFITHTHAIGAKSLIELPLAGYVSEAMNLGPARCGFRVSKYGPQQHVDPLDPDCGNGIFPDGGTMANVDPLDTSIVADEAWTRAWVTHLVSTFGTASKGGVAYYNLGNQPGLWHETHRDIHPTRATYAEIKAKFEAHAAAVKDVDPTAQTLGPAAWGWLEYFDSAANDRATTGIEFIPYYLQVAKAAEAAEHRRLLDYLDVHIYPQAAGVSRGDQSAATNAMRLRSTRILWDPEYVVESWESCCNGGVLKILPRMHEWIEANYPGTRLAVSAYGFGALQTVNGAITQADVLGIFGREGVDLATLDEQLALDSVGEDAFKLYRNYDGHGAKFGDTSVRATSDAADSLATFAAFDSNSRVTVVLLNKDPDAANTAVITFKGVGRAGPWRAFEFSQTGRLAAAGVGAISDGQLTRQLPASSATVIEFSPLDGIGKVVIQDPEQPDAGIQIPTAPSSQVPKPCGCGVSSSALVFALLPLLLVIRRRRA